MKYFSNFQFYFTPPSDDVTLELSRFRVHCVSKFNLSQDKLHRVTSLNVQARNVRKTEKMSKIDVILTPKIVEKEWGLLFQCWSSESNVYYKVLLNVFGLFYKAYFLYLMGQESFSKKLAFGRWVLISYTVFLLFSHLFSYWKNYNLDSWPSSCFSAFVNMCYFI